MHPIDQEFEQIGEGIKTRVENAQSNPLTDVEKGQLAFWGMIGLKMTVRKLALAQEEAQRRGESKKLRDVFWRMVDSAYLISDTRNPAVVRAVKAEVIEEYAALTKRLTDSADVKAQIEAEKQLMADDIAAQQAHAAEVQAVVQNVQQLEKPLQVKRPLNLKNK